MSDVPPGNFLPEACPGCVVVHRSHPLILGLGPAHEDDSPFRWDQDDKVFSIVNTHDHPSFTYLTFCGVAIHDRHGRPFPTGLTRSDSGKEQAATTFVVVLDPRTALRLGRVDAAASLADFYAIELERLEKPPAPLRRPDDEEEQSGPGFGFPLPEALGPYLCTQGVGGHLTHFFPASYHAIDLRCGCHTPVLSIADGVVSEVAEEHHCGGVHAANLAAWNSLSVELPGGLVVEYLHTLPGSAKVRVGDRVRRGQVLCETGDIGFAPEPHLHIELHASGDAEGPSLPLAFGGASGFVPVAGRWYSALGEVAAPEGAPPRGAWRPTRRRRGRGCACVALKKKLRGKGPQALQLTQA